MTKRNGTTSSYSEKFRQGRNGSGFETSEEVHPLAIIDQLINTSDEHYARLRKQLGNIVSEERLKVAILGLRAGIIMHGRQNAIPVCNEVQKALTDGPQYRPPVALDVRKAETQPSNDTVRQPDQIGWRQAHFMRCGVEFSVIYCRHREAQPVFQEAWNNAGPGENAWPNARAAADLADVREDIRLFVAHHEVLSTNPQQAAKFIAAAEQAIARNTAADWETAGRNATGLIDRLRYYTSPNWWEW